jgi:hypothetical protein
MRLKVLTLWQGQVAIRGKYIRRALEAGESITIIHDGAEMTLDKAVIFSSRCGVSDEPVIDKYGWTADYLHYYLWKPDTKQVKMI